MADFCLYKEPSVIHFTNLKIENDEPVIYMHRYLSDLETALITFEERFDFDTKKHVLYQIMQGLYGAHKRSLIHRDISLNNILFNDDGDVVIADWGLSYILNEQGENHYLSTWSKTYIVVLNYY